MTDLWQQYLGLHPGLVLLVVFVFDLPRDLFSYVSVALSRLFESNDSESVPEGRVCVIVSAYNAEQHLRRTLESLKEQTIAIEQVIVVSDGSTDQTWAIAQKARADGLVDLVVRNPMRLGVAASCNKGLLFTRADYVLFVDSDTMVMPTACEELLKKIQRQGCAAVSGNIGVLNARSTLWTALQQVEYMFAIDFGRSFMDKFNAISCLSGAMTMCRRDALLSVGGFSPGSGQDLELTLHLRLAGYRIGFASRAWAYTHVPETGPALIRQRLRWNRDAMRIHIFQYGQFRKSGANEPLGNTLQRYDFVSFIFVPTMLLLSLPLVMIGLNPDQLRTFLLGTYLLLISLAFLNMTFAALMHRGRVYLFSLLLLPVLPFYFGVFLKTVRLYAYISETLWRASRLDDFVPARVRKVLYKD